MIVLAVSDLHENPPKLRRRTSVSNPIFKANERKKIRIVTCLRRRPKESKMKSVRVSIKSLSTMALFQDITVD